MVKGFPTGLHVPSRAIMSYYMSYHRLSWFTLSFVEWWIHLRKGTYHLPVFLLCVPISLLASKCLARESPTPGIVIHFHLDSSTTTPAQNLHCVPIHFKKGKKNIKKLPLKIVNSGRTWSSYLLKKKREKCPWSSAKIVQKRSSIKWPKNVSKSVSPFLPLPWTFVIP